MASTMWASYAVMRRALLLSSVVVWFWLSAQMTHASAWLGDHGHYLRSPQTVFLSNPDGRDFTLTVYRDVALPAKDSTQVSIFAPDGTLVKQQAVEAVQGPMELRVPAKGAGTYKATIDVRGVYYFLRTRPGPHGGLLRRPLGRRRPVQDVVPSDESPAPALVVLRPQGHPRVLPAPQQTPPVPPAAKTWASSYTPLAASAPASSGATSWLPFPSARASNCASPSSPRWTASSGAWRSPTATATGTPTINWPCAASHPISPPAPNPGSIPRPAARPTSSASPPTEIPTTAAASQHSMPNTWLGDQSYSGIYGLHRIFLDNADGRAFTAGLGTYILTTEPWAASAAVFGPDDKPLAKTQFREDDWKEQRKAPANPGRHARHPARGCRCQSPLLLDQPLAPHGPSPARPITPTPSNWK